MPQVTTNTKKMKSSAKNFSTTGTRRTTNTAAFTRLPLTNQVKHRSRISSCSQLDQTTIEELEQVNNEKWQTILDKVIDKKESHISDELNARIDQILAKAGL